MRAALRAPGATRLARPVPVMRSAPAAGGAGGAAAARAACRGAAASPGLIADAAHVRRRGERYGPRHDRGLPDEISCRRDGRHSLYVGFRIIYDASFAARALSLSADAMLTVETASSAGAATAGVGVRRAAREQPRNTCPACAPCAAAAHRAWPVAVAVVVLAAAFELALFGSAHCRLAVAGAGLVPPSCLRLA